MVRVTQAHTWKRTKNVHRIDYERDGTFLKEQNSYLLILRAFVLQVGPAGHVLGRATEENRALATKKHAEGTALGLSSSVVPSVGRPGILGSESSHRGKARELSYSVGSGSVIVHENRKATQELCQYAGKKSPVCSFSLQPPFSKN